MSVGEMEARWVSRTPAKFKFKLHFSLRLDRSHGHVDRSVNPGRSPRVNNLHETRRSESLRSYPSPKRRIQSR